MWRGIVGQESATEGKGSRGGAGIIVGEGNYNMGRFELEMREWRGSSGGKEKLGEMRGGK